MTKFVELFKPDFRYISNEESKVFDLQLYATYLLAYYCMPVLSKIKPSNLIQIKKNNKYIEQLLLIIEHNINLYGCSCNALYENDTTLGLLIYNTQKLDKIICDKDIILYLTECGYWLSDNGINNALTTWKHRYAMYKDFKSTIQQNYMSYKHKVEYPHEIGLLLGYPLEDVKSFIKYSGMNYLLCGYWKVYHDKETAMKIFEAYNKVRLHAIEIIISGGTLEDVLAINSKD